MRISEYIAALETIKAEHGDLEIDTDSYNGARISARPPEIAYRQVLKPRESKPVFWRDFSGHWRLQHERGEKVVRV